MKPAAIVFVALWLGWSDLRSSAAGLAKINRSLRREPKYKTEPYYALVIIGSKAERRVWLVVDGETLYVDRNGNGDLTEANERVALSVKKTKGGWMTPMYKGINSFDIGEVSNLPLRLDFYVRDKDFVPTYDYEKKQVKDYQEKGWEFAALGRKKRGWDFDTFLHGRNWIEMPVIFCRQPKDAQICHLAGPLTFALRWKGDTLVCGSEENDFRVVIGTLGLPARSSDQEVFAKLATTEVPAKVHPVADFEFSHEDAKQPPIKFHVVLEERC